MRVLITPEWYYYFADDTFNQSLTLGKWMYFYQVKDVDEGPIVTQLALTKKIVSVAKHSNLSLNLLNGSGVVCFYVDYYDLIGHQRVVEFMLEHQLIPQTPSGRFYNLAFKLELQTLSGQYGRQFKPLLKLADLLDLETGEWLW